VAEVDRAPGLFGVAKVAEVAEKGLVKELEE
jgi:hypothetical protein